MTPPPPFNPLGKINTYYIDYSLFTFVLHKTKSIYSVGYKYYAKLYLNFRNTKSKRYNTLAVVAFEVSPSFTRHLVKNQLLYVIL